MNTTCNAIPALFGDDDLNPYAKHHHLKCFIDFFQPVVDGAQKAIARKNDRDYQMGDYLTLHEGHNENGDFIATGRTISAQISFIDNFALQPGYVNLSLARVGMLIIKD